MVKTELLDYALKYSDFLKVFPLVPNQKKPYLTGGFHNATNDKEQIKKWWTETPNANIGTVLNDTDYFVIDLDVKNGKNGLKTLSEIQVSETGTNFLDSIKDMDFVAYLTPSRGTHLYFKTDNELIKNINATDLFNGVDVYGKDHYLVLPPSVYHGKPYQSIDKNGKDWFQYDNIPKAPQWLIDILVNQLNYKNKTASFTVSYKNNHRKGRIPQLIEEAYSGIESGSRNVFFTKAFGTLLTANLEPTIAIEVCRDWNERLTDDPLSNNELDKVFKSILTKEMNKREVTQ